MNEVYVSLRNIISQKVVPHFYVFGSGVKHEVFGNTNGTRAKHMRGTWERSSPKSLNVYVIQSSWEQQLATATY
jgi:hypothetical protein